MTKEDVYAYIENATASIEVDIDAVIIARCEIEAEKIGVPVEDYVSALIIKNLRAYVDAEKS